MEVMMKVNLLAVFVAAIAGFIIGAVWYTVLAKPWMEAVGKTAEDLEQSASLYVFAFIFQFIMAFALAMIIERSGVYTLHCGILTGVVTGAGLVLVNRALNASFAGTSMKLVLIDGACATLSYSVQGSIIALWR